MKGLNTQCQPACHEPRVVRSTSSVPGSVQGAASERTATAAHRMRSRRATSAHQRHGRPRPHVVDGLRCVGMSVGRCDEYGSRRRIPKGAPGPFPAGRRRLPGSAGEPRPAPSPQARCLGATHVVAPPGRCHRTALSRQAEETDQKRTEHGPLEGALAARGETGAGVSRETHVLHHESAEECPETE